MGCEVQVPLNRSSRRKRHMAMTAVVVISVALAGLCLLLPEAERPSNVQLGENFSLGGLAQDSLDLITDIKKFESFVSGNAQSDLDSEESAENVEEPLASFPEPPEQMLSAIHRELQSTSLPQCKAILALSDNDPKDNLLDQQEYLNLVNRVSDGFWEDVTSFDDLPQSLQDTFYSFATNGVINIVGVRPDQPQSDEKDVFLQDVCDSTAMAIGQAMTGSDTPPSQGQISLARCFLAMDISDRNNNDELDRGDYVLFVNLLGASAWPGFSYDQLPTVLRGNFVNLAGPAEDDAIDIFGAKSGQDASPEQQAFLEQVCSQTTDAIEIAKMPEPTMPPTQVDLTIEPTVAPEEPTAAPTEATAAPTETVEEPTASPTQAPTVPEGEPTASPTQAPTVPEGEPTASPTQAPTVPEGEPTVEPTAVSSTEFPTESPTSSPTESPTSGPTESPTSGPTESPTSGPTLSPTETTPPTDAPTVTSAPSGTPSPTAEATPTSSPSLSPSSESVLSIPAAFFISNTAGLTAADLEFSPFLKALDDAYRVTAEAVVASTSNSRRTLDKGARVLQLRVEFVDSDIGVISDFQCPPDAPVGTTCQTLPMANFQVDASDSETSDEAIVLALNAAMVAAIDDGTLKQNLDEIAPDNPISVEGGNSIGPPAPMAPTSAPTSVVSLGPSPSPTPAPTNAPDSDDGLSGGAIAGIVVFSVGAATLLGVGGWYVYRKRFKEDETPFYEAPISADPKPAPVVAGAAAATTASGTPIIRGDPQAKDDYDSYAHDSESVSTTDSDANVAAARDNDVESGIHTYGSSSGISDSESGSNFHKDVESGIHTHDSDSNSNSDDSPTASQPDEKPGFSGTYDFEGVPPQDAAAQQALDDVESGEYSSYSSSTQYESEESETSESEDEGESPPARR